MTVRESWDGTRYDDRFVCRWHPAPEGITHGLVWCGLDCPTERYLVGRRILAELAAEGALPSQRHVHDERWDRLRRWALAKEGA